MITAMITAMIIAMITAVIAATQQRQRPERSSSIGLEAPGGPSTRPGRRDACRSAEGSGSCPVAPKASPV